jgi:hypothetical protein
MYSVISSDINIGKLVENVLSIRRISIYEASKHLKLNEDKILKILKLRNIDVLTLVKLSIFLKYNFFRIYTDYLTKNSLIMNNPKEKLPSVKIDGIREKNNLYSKEFVKSLLDKFHSDELTVKDIESIYNVPRTTILYWIKKSNK